MTVDDVDVVLFVSQLLDTKSTDRKMTLLNYIALIVKEKYPELANFYNELHFVEKAAAGELKNGFLQVIKPLQIKLHHRLDYTEESSVYIYGVTFEQAKPVGKYLFFFYKTSNFYYCK